MKSIIPTLIAASLLTAACSTRLSDVVTEVSNQIDGVCSIVTKPLTPEDVINAANYICSLNAVLIESSSETQIAKSFVLDNQSSVNVNRACFTVDSYTVDTSNSQSFQNICVNN